MAKFDEEKTKKRYEELLEKEAEDLSKILSDKYKIPYLDLSRITIDLDSLKILREEEARAGKMAIFQSVGKKLQIGVLNPELPKTKEIVDDLKQKLYIPQLFLISEISLNKALSRYPEVPSFVEAASGIIGVSQKKLSELEEKVKDVPALKELISKGISIKESRKISEVLEIIIAGALALEASDIHIEPSEKIVTLRFRMDGILQEVAFFTEDIYQFLNSRIKLLSELKLNIKDRSQDGRFTIREKDLDVEVRTSTLPGPYGESIVLRILHPRTIGLKFDDLGMEPEIMERMKHELSRPNGMILTTGPTGSGKTTTLYAFVKEVNEPGVKIVTIEDPIEYHLERVVQTQVDEAKGYDFSNGLRSIVRQDPDIILVGEIRDLPTAETAMHAALTGHLVFSTLHTNDAAGTIPRLIDLGVKPNIIAPAINVAMAQRLVRKLCQKCAKDDTATTEELKKIKDEMALMPENKKPDLTNIKIKRPVGCPLCNQSGYKGRVGVFEVFFIDEKIEQLILSDPSEGAIKEAAFKQGMATLKQEGILKIIRGVTTFEELERIVG